MWLYVQVENRFVCWENYENYHPEKLAKISEICKNHFFVVNSNPVSQWFVRKCYKQWAKSYEQQAKSDDQRATSKKFSLKKELKESSKLKI